MVFPENHTTYYAPAAAPVPAYQVYFAMSASMFTSMQHTARPGTFIPAISIQSQWYFAGASELALMRLYKTIPTTFIDSTQFCLSLEVKIFSTCVLHWHVVYYYCYR